MPLMKTDDGKLFTSIETVNRYLAPNTLCTFEISDEINRSAKAGSESEKLWELFPKDLDHDYRKMGYDNRLLFHIEPEIYQKEKSASKSSLTLTLIRSMRSIMSSLKRDFWFCSCSRAASPSSFPWRKDLYFFWV